MHPEEPLATEPETNTADRVETLEDIVLNFGGNFKH